MVTLIFILHILCCIFLICLILVQKTQGSEIGAAFGGASQTVFGSRGPATFLNKLTIGVAVFFLAASLFLAQVAKNKTVSSVVDEASKLKTQKVEEQAPAAAPEKAPVEEGATDKGETK